MRFIENGINNLYLHDMSLDNIKKYDGDLYVKICLGGYAIWTNEALNTLYFNGKDNYLVMDLKFNKGTILNDDFVFDIEESYEILDFKINENNTYTFCLSIGLDYVELNIQSPNAYINRVECTDISDYFDNLDFNYESNLQQFMLEDKETIYLDITDDLIANNYNNILLTKELDKTKVEFSYDYYDEFIKLLLDINMKKNCNMYSILGEKMLISEYIEKYYPNYIEDSKYNGTFKIHKVKCNMESLYMKLNGNFKYVFRYNWLSNCIMVMDDYDNPVFIYEKNLGIFKRNYKNFLYNRKNKKVYLKILEILSISLK